MEEAQGMSASANIAAPVENSGSHAAPAHSAQQTAYEPPREKNFSQSELNEIVKREKYGAIEDFKRSQGSQQRAPEQSGSFNEQQVRDLVAKEAQRLNEEARDSYARQTREREASETAQEFYNKINAGKSKYADFDDVMDGLDYVRFPTVVGLATKYADNTADVMYELGKDRTKMAAFEQLARTSQQDAIKQMQRFSSALKANESAANVRHPKEPLSQIRPTNTGTDNERLSVSDYRKKYRG